LCVSFGRTRIIPEYFWSVKLFGGRIFTIAFHRVNVFAQDGRWLFHLPLYTGDELILVCCCVVFLSIPSGACLCHKIRSSTLTWVLIFKLYR
jgi:hypothetical protein